MDLFTDVLHLGLGNVFERVPQVRHLDSRTELSSYQCPRDGSSLLALKALLSLVRHKVIQLMGDNSTVVTDIENKGSTRSFRLTRLTIRLFRFCDQHSIILLPVHLPGARNVTADALSRVGCTLTTEWSISHRLLQPVFSTWGTPAIDMFATYSNKRLPTFVSPFPDDRALHVDAMSIHWSDKGILYMFLRTD